MEKISVVPKPYQSPHPPIHQVVDGIRSIEWAAQNGINDPVRQSGCGIIVKNAFWYSPLKSISVRYGSPQLPFFMSEFLLFKFDSLIFSLT